MAWRYFNDTGKVGGAGTDTIYIDSYKGSDATGTGTNANPYKTIQKGIDGATLGNGADLIVAGRFKEGDFVGVKYAMSIIAEGDVYIYSGAFTQFRIGSNRTSFNIDYYSGQSLRGYGKLIFDGYSNVYIGVSSTSNISGNIIGMYNSVFKNISSTMGFNSVKIAKNCIFDGADWWHYSNITGSNEGKAIIEGNTFINGGKFRHIYTYTSGVDFRDNYGDSGFTFNHGNASLVNFLIYNNHIEGSSAGKFALSTNLYTDLDVLQVAQGNVYDNVPYANSPQFKGLNSGDYTYDNASPNATGGYAGGPIGAFGVGYSTKTIDAVGAWTLSNINIVGVGVNSVANLASPGTGTLTEVVGVQIGFGEDVYIGPVSLPNMIVDHSNGETIDTTDSATGGTPSIPTLEIDYSLDTVDGTQGSGSWSGFIEVPIGVQPLIDGAGRGNGDAAFDPSTATKIAARWVRSQITLRDNEVVLP